MGFHKHGSFSFTIAVQKMRAVGGDNFVADLTALRHHEPNGAARPLFVPVIAEQYGETAQDAEGKVIDAICSWLDRAARVTCSGECPQPSTSNGLDLRPLS